MKGNSKSLSSFLVQLTLSILIITAIILKEKIWISNPESLILVNILVYVK